jgi:polysaccharide pyruvyl transferase WcaK-like protein
VVGIGPMGFFDPRSWPEKDATIYYEYLEKLASLAQSIINSGHNVSLFTGDADCDRLVIEDLLNILENKGICRNHPQVQFPYIKSVDDLMSCLLQTDLTIASRFHGVLLSLLVNKPVIALSYHPKVTALMADVGLKDLCYPIETFSLDVIQERLNALINDREEVRAKIKKRVNSYRYALDEQYQNIFSK